MKKILAALETAGGACGLDLNKQKTKIVQVRGKKISENIGEYKIEEEVKYLGIQIGGSIQGDFPDGKQIMGRKGRKEGQ